MTATREDEFAALEAEGWERFEGEARPGFMVLESPEGATFQLPLTPGLIAAQARWRAQMEAERAVTPYQRRKRREAEAAEDARYEARMAAVRAARLRVRRETLKAIREGRTPTVVLFTANPEQLYGGVQR